MMDRNGTGQTQKIRKNEGELSFYWQHYGLNRDPFPVVFDHTTYFPLPSWEHHLDLLQHLISNENVLLAVIGGEGSGKTTFAAQFSQMFNDNYLIHSFQADSLFSTRKLVRELEAGFNLKAPNNEAPEEQLDAQIAEVQHKENTCLLIIDDAHFLPLETINSLLFLLKQQSKNQMRLHIVLFGDKNLQAKLANLAKHDLSGDIIHTIELEPLTFEETKQYLEYRLNKAGLNAEIPFSQTNIEKIYANSDGVPDKINLVAQQILLEQLKKQNEQVESSMFKRHQTKIIGGCLLVVVLIAASYVLNKQGQNSAPQNQQAAISFANQNQTVTPPPQQQAGVVTAANNTSNTATDASNVAAANNNAQTPIANQTPNQIPDQTSAQTPAQSNQAAETDTTNQVATAAPQTNSPADQTNDQTTAQTNSQPATALINNDTEATPDQAENQIIAKSKVPAIGPEEKELTQMENAVKTSKKTNDDKKHEAVIKTKVKQHHAAHSKNVKTNPIKNALLKRNGNEYTLQVLGLSNEKAMKNFIKKNKLSGQAHYIKTTLHGKPWFILVYGVYKNRETADNAIHRLPASLKKYHAWPRTLGNVKADMNKG